MANKIVFKLLKESSIIFNLKIHCLGFEIGKSPPFFALKEMHLYWFSDGFNFSRRKIYFHLYKKKLANIF